MNPLQRLLARLRARAGGTDDPATGPVSGDATASRDSDAPRPVRARTGDDALVARVRAEAFAHVKLGMYDLWSFDRGTLPPYIAELRGEREEAINDWRQNLAAQLRTARAAVETVDAEADNADRTAAFDDERLRAAERQEEITRAKMDWLAAHEVRRRPEPPDAPMPGGRDGAGDATAPADEPTGCPHDRHPHECWEGLHDGEPLRPRTRRAILLGLVGIEVPIQYEIFRSFHGDSPMEQLQTWIFTLPVAAVMIVLPHLAGYLYRGRHRTGTERIMSVLPPVILIPWFYLAWFLGRLRASVLLKPPTVNGRPLLSSGTGQSIPTPARELGVSHLQVGIMYMGLLIATGGIAFLLGIACEHPFETAYRRAYTALRNAQQAVVATASAARDALSSRRRAHGSRNTLENEYDERVTEGVEAVHHRYDRAELAYLEALAEAVGDAPFTEAVGIASRALLQAQLRPEVREERDLPSTPTRDSA